MTDGRHLGNTAKYASAMKPGYWERWNDGVQSKIDRDIEANRKADGRFAPEGVPAGAEVRVEQIKSEFFFGAHIFNFDQLGSDERNAKYRALYGDGGLFNSATIAFYWKTLEPEEGRPRFRAEYRDTAEFWNNCPDPARQPHWRRPATDPVVEFCEKKGIRKHGHTLVWGSNSWQVPDWLIGRTPLEALARADFERRPSGTLKAGALSGILGEQSVEEFAERHPEYVEYLNAVYARHIVEIAARYGDRIDSWDVVNESVKDFKLGALKPGSKLCVGGCGPMPGDYPFRSFKIAESVLPDSAKLTINAYRLSEDYLEQVRGLLARGCKIDVMGAQMHLFDPQTCLDIADGVSDAQSPEQVTRLFEMLGKAGLPIHLSEITITAPHNDERGRAIQAVIARNLYRLWFSLKPMTGITWWTVVDDCGAPGEPSVSGHFSRDMEPKLAYFAL
ncbi:MAG: endo-1,4-beta-xylanase, partial [Lentisphaeria bacterium]|nr:endo-1,4-beta-xylanase [Lentisphaeria bacterium]